LSLLSISYFYLGGNNLVTSVASSDIFPNEAALADLPKVSTVYPDKSSTAVSPIICLLLTLLSLSVNADPVEDVWDWANDNPIATAAIVVGGGITVGVLP
jgi:hypothetical protein